MIDENQLGGPHKVRTGTLLESSRIDSLPEHSGRAGISTLMQKKDARHFKGPDPSVSSGYQKFNVNYHNLKQSTTVSGHNTKVHLISSN